MVTKALSALTHNYGDVFNNASFIGINGLESFRMRLAKSFRVNFHSDEKGLYS